MPARAHQVRALAPRRVAIGRLGSRDCACLAGGSDSCRRRARPRPRTQRAHSPDRHGPRPSTFELQDSVGRAAARCAAGGVPAAHTTTAETRTPRLFGQGRPGLLAGASPRAGGWAQIRINSDIARRAMRRLVCADRSRLRPKQSNAARDCRDYSDTKPFAARCIPTCATCLFTGRALSVSPASSLSLRAWSPTRVLVPRSLQQLGTQSVYANRFCACTGGFESIRVLGQLEASKAGRPNALGNTRPWAPCQSVARPMASSVGLQARGAAGRLRRPATRKCQSRWLAGPAGD